MLKIRDPKGFWSGILFTALGGAAIAISSAYRLGIASKMGPGYFPRVLGIILVALGVLQCLRGLKDNGEPFGTWNWRPTLIVLGSVVAFGLIVAKIGLVVSTIALIFAASTASHDFRPKEALFSGVLLAALAVGVFVVGLKLQLPIWPVFL